MHKDKDKFVNEYVDINGVKVIFTVMKDKLHLQKKDLMKLIQSNTKEIDKINIKLKNLSDNLGENYYTKTEVNNLLPEGLLIEDIEKAYNEK